MPKTYYCSECKGNHRHGKIYEEHMRYKRSEPDNVPSKKILKCNWDYLRPIAQRQIMHYARKMLLDKQNNGSSRKEMYIHEINKVIMHEDDDIVIKL